MSEGTFSLAHQWDIEERTKDVTLKKSTPFSQMLLNEHVHRGLLNAGYTYPTFIQAAAIPISKSGIDLLVQSKSGTGKTLIFTCLILETYSVKIPEPQSLIVVPTREIAIQIENVLNTVGKYLPGFRALCVIGGMDVTEDRKRLQGCKSVVGTPGRILHLIRNNALNTSRIKIFVLDEADKMYNHSFREDLQFILNALPVRQQTIACSATFYNGLDIQLSKIMYKPMLITNENRGSMLLGIKQFVYELPESHSSILEMRSKLKALNHIFSSVSFQQCLIFAGSQTRADSYCSYLEKDGWPCELIIGSQNQKVRSETFRKFREFGVRIIITTDLMSRGVDSEHLNLVINLELPQDFITYLHRIGRAGRFGSYGLVINFLSSKNDHQLFTRLIREIGSGMTILKFPTKSLSQQEELHDIWNFSQMEKDIEYFGTFEYENNDNTSLLTRKNAPFTPQEDNRNVNTMTDREKLDVNSVDNEAYIPIKENSARQNQDLVTAETLDLAQCTPTCSQHSSNQCLVSSNTIDDASSIAADSILNNQSDASFHQYVCKKQLTMPTLVDSLNDAESSSDNDHISKKLKSKTDLFHAYSKEICEDYNSINNNTEVSSDNSTSFDSEKLEHLKSLLIDNPDNHHRSSHYDPYTDHATYSDVDSNNSNDTNLVLNPNKSIVDQDSLKELENCMHCYTEIEPISTESVKNKTDSLSTDFEIKHFPSPVHHPEHTSPVTDRFRVPDIVPLNTKNSTFVTKGLQVKIPLEKLESSSESQINDGIPSRHINKISSTYSKESNKRILKTMPDRLKHKSSIAAVRTICDWSDSTDNEDETLRSCNDNNVHKSHNDETDANEHYFDTDEKIPIDDYDETTDSDSSSEHYFGSDIENEINDISSHTSKESNETMSSMNSPNSTLNSNDDGQQIMWNKWRRLYVQQINIIENYVKISRQLHSELNIDN